MPSISVCVKSKAYEALDICSFELIPTGGKDLPSFSAGSHIDVNLPAGLIRQYSLCNSPSDRNRYLIAVLNDPSSRGGSRWMHESLAEGQVLQISAPQNQFALAEGAEHYLLIAGGIGITPILCMAESLANIDYSFELHYTARSPESMAFAEHIRSAPFSPKAQLYLSGGKQREKMDLATILSSPKPCTHVYVCGPKRLIEAAFDTALSMGWMETQLHREFFSAPVIEQPLDQSFDVKLASSGQVISVPKGTTVVDALADAGIQIITSCEQGFCGTCITRVLEGTPDHRDTFLTTQQHEANDEFAPCCSRSKTAMLVLDL